MRVWIAFFMLTIATPVYAQTTTGSTSGASSMVDISSPANTTTHLITTPTVAAPGLAAAGIETCLGSASGGLSLMGGGYHVRRDEGRRRLHYPFAVASTVRLRTAQGGGGADVPGRARGCCHGGRRLALSELPCRAAANMSPMQQPRYLLPRRPTRRFTILCLCSRRPSITHTGYILDLKRADSNAPVHIAFTPVAPYSQQEQAWFDRASDVN